MSISPSSQRPSLFGAAAFQKAINVVAHYVEFSDKSSSWSGSQSGDERTETPDNNEELRTPLLQSHPIPSDDSADAPEADLQTPRQSYKAEIVPADQLTQQLHNLAQMDVLCQRESADASSSSNEGTETPSKDDLRAPLLLSQPPEQDTQIHGSPKVAATNGLEQLGSGLLDPGLLQQLLDDDAPPPDMPPSPIRHVESFAVPLIGSHGMYHKLKDSATHQNITLVTNIHLLQYTLHALCVGCWHAGATCQQHILDQAEHWHP